MRNLGEVFTESFPATLQAEGVDGDTIERVMSLFEDLDYRKTASRSTLGYLNEVVRELQWHLGGQAEWTEQALLSLVKRLNRTPWVKTQFVYAIEAMEPVLREDFGWRGRFEKHC